MRSQAAAFTVLSAPVALCDRRALSEAWFSALHLHKERSTAPASVAAPRTAVAHASKSPNLAPHAAATTAAVPISAAVRIGAAGALAGAPGTERRVLRSKLAQKIEQAFLKPQQPPKHASFALEGQRGRVQILLRTAGGATQIVALCPPAAREVVAHALSQARYALAMRGINIQAGVRGFAQ